MHLWINKKLQDPNINKLLKVTDDNYLEIFYTEAILHYKTY